MGSALVPGILGAVGLMQSNKQQKKQTKAITKASDAQAELSAIQKEALDKLRSIAEGYNPGKETDAAVGYASDVAGANLDKALRRLRVGYGGGNPSGDTNFHISAQRAANDVYDPLKAFAADRKASETARTAALWQTILGVPAGQMADSYWKTAAMTPPGDSSASLQLLAQSLPKLFAGSFVPKDQSRAATGGSDSTTDILQSIMGGIR